MQILKKRRRVAAAVAEESLLFTGACTDSVLFTAEDRVIEGDCTFDLSNKDLFFRPSNSGFII